jgi:hypothetical protein
VAVGGVNSSPDGDSKKNCICADRYEIFWRGARERLKRVALNFLKIFIKKGKPKNPNIWNVSESQ